MNEADRTSGPTTRESACRAVPSLTLPLHEPHLPRPTPIPSQQVQVTVVELADDFGIVRHFLGTRERLVIAFDDQWLALAVDAHDLAGRDLVEDAEEVLARLGCGDSLHAYIVQLCVLG